MRIALSQACAATLRGADLITAVDRNRPGYYQNVYSGRGVVRGRMPGTGPYLNQEVFVEIDGSDDWQLRTLRDVVRASGFVSHDQNPRQ